MPGDHTSHTHCATNEPDQGISRPEDRASALVDVPLLSTDYVLKALEEGRLELWFQPIVDMISRRPEWHEGLARLRTREGETLTPNRFIPQAEREPRLIQAIDHYVLRLAVHHLRRGDLPKLSVNISGVSLAEPDFGLLLRELCSPLALNQQQLILEITETAMIRNMEAALINCRIARGLGIELAIDDFGEAFNSMTVLRDLPLTILKIDGSFAEDIQDSHKCWLITDWMLRLARELGMHCVLEYISSEEICQEALKMDFRLGQGFHLGRPQPLEVIRMQLAEYAATAASCGL